jgi:uncharacterized membrane protein YfcA
VIADAALIALVLFGAALLRSIFGFGDALFAMPLASLVVGVTVAAPVVGLVSLVLAAGVLVASRRHVDVATVRYLLAASLVGIPVGVSVLSRADEGALRLTLGAIVIGFGLYRLFSPRLPELHHRRWALPFGFAAGCLGGAYNIGGPPVVLYGALRGWSAPRFRGTLQGYFLVTSIVIALAQGLGGLWTREVLVLVGASTPGVVAALWWGQGLARRLEPATFDRHLSLVLVALGVLLLL